MKLIHPPTKKKPEKPGQPAGPEKQPDPEEDKSGRSAQGTGAAEASRSASPSPEELNTAWSAPVTNQDEQDKITNTGGDDLPLADN